MIANKENRVKRERAQSAKTYKQTKIQKEFLSAGMTMGEFIGMSKGGGMYESELAAESIIGEADEKGSPIKKQKTTNSISMMESPEAIRQQVNDFKLKEQRELRSKIKSIDDKFIQAAQRQ